jgi:hypothetical protein
MSKPDQIKLAVAVAVLVVAGGLIAWYLLAPEPPPGALPPTRPSAAAPAPAPVDQPDADAGNARRVRPEQ